MLRNLRNSIRLLQIAVVLAKHDALFVFDRLHAFPVLSGGARLVFRRHRGMRPGLRLAAALRALGPSFIKLGQAFSTRADLIGEEIAHDLSELQDKVPPFPSAQARAIVEASLGRPIAALFARFDEHPVAAGSIAQVHFAETAEGAEVAVKILRPGIVEAFERDLELFEWIAEIVEKRLPDFRRMRPREMVETVRSIVEFELDLRYEAASAVELAENTANDEGFKVPFIDWSRTSEQVLTLERITGTPIHHVDQLRAQGHDLNAILSIAATSFFNQVFRDGFFHADMHPGNVFVTPEGEIAVVDFGIMGRLDWPNRTFLARVLHGFLTQDYAEVAKIHFEYGIVPRYKSEAQFALACRAIAQPILGKPLNEISVGRLLGQLFSVSEAFEMRLQPQFLLLQKSMMITEGIGYALNPGINTWKLSEPLIAEWYRRNLGVAASLRQHAEEAAEQLKRLPGVIGRLDRLLEAFDAGRELFVPAIANRSAVPRGPHREERRGASPHWSLVLLSLSAAAGVVLAALWLWRAG